ncbi:hypothetical protein LBMAG21_15620 [Armatimonadota bacterium]|nr:hypothetical protein LBMAG21_15620 [Armatimonadota bacterium]
MPQFQQQKKGFSRVRVLSKDATRAYLLMVKKSKGRSLQALPGDIFQVDAETLKVLDENAIPYEVIEQK